MTDLKDTPPKAADMTKEQAAKFVQRLVPKTDKDGKPVLDAEKQPVLEGKPVPPEEIIGWKDYGDHVIVVTTAGEKLRGDKKKSA